MYKIPKETDLIGFRQQKYEENCTSAWFTGS
jgi:hypothetical protein